MGIAAAVTLTVVGVVVAGFMMYGMFLGIARLVRLIAEADAWKGE